MSSNQGSLAFTIFINLLTPNPLHLYVNWSHPEKNSMIMTSTLGNGGTSQNDRLVSNIRGS